MTSRNVLIAAYYFPPFADVSGVRATKFCKYLPRNGWCPIVLTVDARYYGKKVLDRVAPEVEALDVRRIRFLPVFGATLFVKLLYPFIVCATAFRNRKKIDAVYFCGSPFHPFAASSFITGLLGIPTVLDFRDSWGINEGFDSHTSGPRAASLRSRIERMVKQTLEWIGIRFASKVVFATSVLQDEYAAVFPAYTHKFGTITNGYDPDDFIDVNPKNATGFPRTVVLTGKFLLYTPQAAELFLQALADFPDIAFLYVGGEAEQVTRLAAELGVSSQVTALGYMPYRKVLELVKGAEYGLVTTGLINGMGTKIFDYIALRKPTLCLVPRGSVIAREFAGDNSVVICETPHTQVRIREAIAALLETPARWDDKTIAEFSRETLAGQLATILTETYASRPEKSVRSAVEG